MTVLARPTISREVSRLAVAPRRMILLGWMLWAFVGAGVGEKYLHLPLSIIWVGLYGPILLLFAIWVLDSSTRPVVHMSSLPVVAMALFAAYLVLSAVIAKAPFFGLVINLRDYFKYILLFFPMAALFSREANTRSFLRLAALLLIIQPPLVFYQFIFESGMAPVDADSGTLGFFGTGQLMMLVAYTTAIAVSLWRQGYGRWQCVALVIWLVPMIPFMGAFAGVVFVPMGALIGAAAVGLRRWQWRLVLLCFLAVLMVGGFSQMGGVEWIENRFGFLGHGISFGLRRLTAEVADASGNRGRLYDLEQVWRQSDASGHLWFGHGVGITTTSLQARLAGRYVGGFLEFVSLASMALYEQGIVGVGLYLLVLAAMAWGVYRQRAAFRGAFWRGLYGAYFAFLALHISGAVYQATWTSTWSSFPVWFLSAILIGRSSAEVMKAKREGEPASCGSQSPS